MNEKIIEFAKQAGVLALSEKGIAPPLERFAELIVRECAEVADCRSSFKHNSGSKILRYFGVTE